MKLRITVSSTYVVNVPDDMRASEIESRLWSDIKAGEVTTWSGSGYSSTRPTILRRDVKSAVLSALRRIDAAKEQG
jgi:hypothetical protein